MQNPASGGRDPFDQPEVLGLAKTRADYARERDAQLRRNADRAARDAPQPQTWLQRLFRRKPPLPYQ